MIRHGKTPMNLEHRYIGNTDESLSEEGISQIKELWIECPEAEIVFSSPMKRCIETAGLIFPDRPSYDLIIIPEWKEMDFGLFEGKNYKELSGNPLYQKWIDSGGRDDFPGGEGMAGFKARVADGFEQFMRICAPLAENNAFKTAAVVHGGTIMAVMSMLTGGDYFDFMCKHGTGYRLALSPDGKLIKEPEKIFA